MFIRQRRRGSVVAPRLFVSAPPLSRVSARLALVVAVAAEPGTLAQGNAIHQSPLTVVGDGPVGCGAGLISVCYARLWRNVVGVDVFGRVHPHSKITSYENAMWLTIITMTTVGYGDMFPNTICGRAVAVITARVSA